MRCQSILLKSKGRTSKETGRITGMCNMSVNSWFKRFKSEGIAGLSTKPSRGRKPVINEMEDKSAILDTIKLTAKAEWEASSGKSVCRKSSNPQIIMAFPVTFPYFLSLYSSSFST
jgi:transposase